ncbi:MAG: IPT/TIG domain-containing protein [Dehalococcoidia bacterium]|nr:IPT/TIG domain-containing protein [Dehalococcoidia bacterium]
MTRRIVLLAALAATLVPSLAAFATTAEAEAAPKPVCPGSAVNARASVATAPTITVDPAQAYPGDTVTVTITGFLPNIDTELTLRIGGDPVVDTGTTDATGRVVLTFTVPAALSGTYDLRATNANLCGIIGQLTILPRNIPTPTPTQPTPPTPTATTTATPPPTQVTTTPTLAATNTPTRPAATPAVPVAGGGNSDGPFSGGSGNMAMIALGLVAVSGAFLLFRTSHRPAHVAAADMPDEWSTEVLPEPVTRPVGRTRSLLMSAGKGIARNWLKRR